MSGGIVERPDEVQVQGADASVRDGQATGIEGVDTRGTKCQKGSLHVSPGSNRYRGRIESQSAEEGNGIWSTVKGVQNDT